MLRKMDYIGVQSEALPLNSKAKYSELASTLSLSKGCFTLLRQAQQRRQIQRTSDLGNTS